MTDFGIPHFQNDLGVMTILVGARRFMCIGATPPFDHPHVFIDLGTDTEAICSYCGTHYKLKPGLLPTQAEPQDCVWDEHAAAA